MPGLSGTPVTVIRPFNTYGPRQSARAVIPTIISQLASGMKTINLGALTPTRDFTYVTDTAKGFEKALHATTGFGEVTNLGVGFEVSIGETFNIINDIMGAGAVATEDPNRIRPANSEGERLFSDNTKAKTVLGWEPEIKGLDGFRVGLEKTVEWFTNPVNLSRNTFASSENLTTSYRPALTIDYTPPVPPSMDLDANNSTGATGSNFSGTFVENGGAVRVADTDATIATGTATTLNRVTVTEGTANLKATLQTPKGVVVLESLGI